MRVALYFGVALLITLSIFSFMRYLIAGRQIALDETEIAAVVEIYRPPPRTTEPEPEPEPEPEEMMEPSMDSLTVSAAPTPRPSAKVENLAPSLALGDISIDVGAVGKKWSAPLSGAGAGAGGFLGGEDNQGYIEVIPFSTGQPNIPDMAWQNKINGWVLVAFNVKRNGETDNVRVLDANPRGVFEDNVVWAVSQWRYSVKGLDSDSGDLILTQKIELSWRDYPNNSPGLNPR